MATDATNVAVGAILEQNFGQGLSLVAFGSCKINNAETHYSAYEHELLGIVWALRQWRHYFQEPHQWWFILITLLCGTWKIRIQLI